MGAIVGIVVVFAMVFGGYLAAGGKIGIILKALPFEMMMIGGAAVGAFVVSVMTAHTIKHTMGEFGKLFKAARNGSGRIINDLLCLLYELIRRRSAAKSAGIGSSISRSRMEFVESSAQIPEDHPNGPSCDAI